MDQTATNLKAAGHDCRLDDDHKAVLIRQHEQHEQEEGEGANGDHPANLRPMVARFKAVMLPYTIRSCNA